MGFRGLHEAATLGASDERVARDSMYVFSDPKWGAYY